MSRLLPYGAGCALVLLTAGACNSSPAKTADVSSTPSPVAPTPPAPTPLPVTVQPPPLVSPTANALQGRRPTFVVGAAERSAPGRAVSYRFDISSDAQFTTVLASATIAETRPNTSFTPASDLPLGLTFYWRARTTDADAGVSSEWSAAERFGVRMEDGKYRYWWSVFVPPACNQQSYTGPNPIVFDDALVVAGDRLTYAPWVALDFPVPVQLQLTRQGNDLAGTVGGTVCHPAAPCGTGLTLQIGPAVALATSGQAQDPDRYPTTASTTDGETFAGTFEGGLRLFNSYNTNNWCSSRTVRWTLSPRRP